MMIFFLLLSRPFIFLSNEPLKGHIVIFTCIYCNLKRQNSGTRSKSISIYEINSHMHVCIRVTAVTIKKYAIRMIFTDLLFNN